MIEFALYISKSGDDEDSGNTTTKVGCKVTLGRSWYRAVLMRVDLLSAE